MYKKRAFSGTSSAPADEPQIVELSHLILHHRRGVPQLGTVVLVVSRPHSHHGPIPDVPKRDHLERHRQRLIRPPMRR